MPANTKANTNNIAYNFLKKITCGDSTHDTDAHCVDLLFVLSFCGVHVAGLQWGINRPYTWEALQKYQGGIAEIFDSQKDFLKTLRQYCKRKDPAEYMAQRAIALRASL